MLPRLNERNELWGAHVPAGASLGSHRFRLTKVMSSETLVTSLKSNVVPVPPFRDAR